MNRAKKLVSLLMALMMVFAMVGTAMAATTDITISGGASNATYVAYKLLNATNAVDADGNATDKFAYTLNEKYTSILQSVTGKSEQADIIQYIADLTGKAEDIRTFADSVYAKIKEEKLAADYTTTNDKFSVDQGYYLIAESVTGDASDTFSLVMLDTAGVAAIEVMTKEDAPEVEKKVTEKNDSTGTTSAGDVADYDVGDDVPFTITGTVSSKYADYVNYYYSFEDTMSEGLTLNEDSIKVTIGVVDVTEQFTITNTDNGFTATANLKKLTGVVITANTEIVVTYTAKLNENAVIGGNGNTNKVVLKYENDPYREGDGEPENPGKTPEDINVVFTYEAIVNKTDEAGAPLEGAGFTLYKWNAEQNNWVAVGSEITGKTTFEFERLDAGKYKLVETTVPAGYNKADDIEFEVVATYTTDNNGISVIENLTVASSADEKNENGETTKFAFTANVNAGSVTGTIVNNAGVELPSTGGVGTTMLYVGGGALIVIAVVLLVSKKRKA